MWRYALFKYGCLHYPLFCLLLCCLACVLSLYCSDYLSWKRLLWFILRRLAYDDDIVVLSSSYSETQGLLEAVNRHAVAVGMRINASKTKVMSALVPDEQRQAVLLDGEPLEDVSKIRYLGSMCVANGQGTEDIRSRINLARSAFSRLQSCRWSRREISLRIRGRVNQVVVRSILLYGCETWPVRVADERMLEFFDNDTIRHILRVMHRDCVPPVELHRRLCLKSIPALLAMGKWLGEPV